MPLKRKTFPLAHDDERIIPDMRGWYQVCCDCSLTHRYRFWIVTRPDGKQHVELSARRSPRYTAQQRRANARTSRRKGT